MESASEVGDMKDHIEKINQKEAVIGVVGLGYVGLPLSVAFAKKFKVHSFDVDVELIEELKQGKSRVEDVPDSLLSSILGKSLFPTSDESVLSECDFIVICVPTPLTESKEPDLRHIKGACEVIQRSLRKGQFIILESTTYPGTTDSVVVPILEKSGLKAGRDFGVAYSPERIDPGNKEFTLETTPRVVGGINGECTVIAQKLYESIVNRVIPVRDCRTAEATKLLENIFRNVNIAMINEMALIFEKMDINTWEVIEAASSKPYGFLAFYPGPGVGGHCIPLDPFYMSYRAKQFGLTARFIELGGEVNAFMRFHVVNLLVGGLSRTGKTLKESVIAVLGLAYKPNINDTRESPAKKVIEEILLRGGTIRVYDPFVTHIETEAGIFQSGENVEDTLRDADAVILLVDHDVLREINSEVFSEYMNTTPVIVDTRNILEKPHRDIVYIGLGKGRMKHSKGAI